MKLLRTFLSLSWLLALASIAATPEQSLTLHTRNRVASTADTNEFAIVEKAIQWNPRKTAIVVCDMWDQHWCKGATARVGEMAPRMNEVLKAARQRGVFVIHCPSSTMDFYKDTPQRKRAQSAPVATPKVPLQDWCRLDAKHEHPLPIDDSDDGCDDLPRCPGGGPWKRQIATLEIADGDAITDSAEAYYLMQQRGIDNVIVMGVHINMCVLGRPFSIRQMSYQGKNVVLMRDLTDSMYNSRAKPYVNHFRGTELVTEHIEKFWCASITSADFLGGEPFHFKDDKRPHVVFMIGENEYRTWETLPQFAKKELEWRGIKCSFVNASPKEGDNNFVGAEAIKDADLLVLSIRRRTPTKAVLDLVRQHVAAGKAVVGIRTASHAFDATPPDAEHDSWPKFDLEVLGSHYENHYNNKPPKDPTTLVKVIPEAVTHPVLTGIPAQELPVTSHLYKYRNHANTMTPLMTGRIEGRPDVVERVAWVYTGNNRRVFYTSLGGPEDFQQPFFRRLLLNGVLWALNKPIPPAEKVATSSAVSARTIAQETQENPLGPEESLARFKVADDLEIEQVLAEPIVAQPVFLNFDERGRMWVVQYRQYPHPAGLKMMSHDNVWRAVYDKVPPPPPHHFRGEDKITIHEDTDGDGKFDKHTTFVDGLNICTSVERGRGGVWVLNPPYLLFYRDENNDDVPDGDPEVRLAGFGLEDTHSVANSLRWGPDGWLYGAQGSTVTANIFSYGADGKPLNAKPIYSQGQNIWRYHPETRRYEVFAEGGGNAFGCEIDSKGRVFSGHNGGNTRGFHYQQGAYLQKGFEKHGPLSNPYAFGYFPQMPHDDVERFTHNFIIYEGGALPVRYEGKLFGVEPLQGRVVYSEITPDKSSFCTRDLGYVVTSEDKWFKPVDIKAGPDGAIYVCDWYDRQVNHYRNHEGQIDKGNGRIYRLKAKQPNAQQYADSARILSRVSKASTKELASLLTHPNKWFRQLALRLLADRHDKSLSLDLEEILQRSGEQTALEALWAMNASGNFDDALAKRLLQIPAASIRAWTVRLLGDANQILPDLAPKLAELAARETDLEVRDQLASTAKRLPANYGLPVIRALLAHSEDVVDNRLPLLLWWAIESKAESDRDSVMAMFNDTGLWDLPLVREHILARLMRRYAMAGTRQDLLSCARLLDRSPNTEVTAKLMSGFEEAFKGRAMTGLPDKLIEAMAKVGGESIILGLRRGDAESVAKALSVIADESADKAKRLRYIQTFGEVKEPRCVPVLLKLVGSVDARIFHKPALTALQQYDELRIGGDVVAAFNQFTNETRTVALTLLASRPAWALQLLQAVDAGQITKAQIPQDVLLKLKRHEGTSIAELIKKHWGQERVATTAEMQQQIDRFAQMVRGGSGSPYEGQKLFMGSCGACHKLFGQGGQIGPDLTTFKRDDLDTMLLSIVNPNAEIREGYENYFVTTKDGRTLSGFLADKDNRVVVLRGIDGENVILPHEQVQEMKAAGLSLMPEGMLGAFEDQQVRDLFAYLRSTQPLVR
ncbi:MAG: ThuA domain-containing protein [Verrucomicrobia bacterium]|nr:ThuA domain-containing protein [Verrucomicrobiota bacterium]